jgi:benzodiazapine receptor
MAHVMPTGGGLAKQRSPATLRCGQAGKNIGTVARRWSNHIKPDGWALSIWLVIYTLLIGFVVWQYRSATPRASEIVKRIGWLFVASSACSAGWVIVYVQGTPLSAVVAMLLMWTLVACNVAICWKTAWRPADAHGRELAEVLVVDLCFSIYAGWGEFKAALHLSQPAGRQRCLTGSLVTN